MIKIFKDFLLLSFILFSLNSSFSWGMNIENEEERNTKISIIKSLPLPELKFINSYMYKFLNMFQYLSDKKSVSIIKRDGLEALPKVLLKEIGTYLDPLSIIKLSQVSTVFRECFNNEFWAHYNSIHRYKSFTEEYLFFVIFQSIREASPIKVAAANYFYEIGLKTGKQNLIEKSSLLGLSKAKRYLEKENSKNVFMYQNHIVKCHLHRYYLYNFRPLNNKSDMFYCPQCEKDKYLK